MGKQTLVVEMGTNGCYGNSDQVSFLEHVVLKISLRHSKRGDLQIFLTSPAGTRSEILHRRFKKLYTCINILNFDFYQSTYY